MSSRLGDPAITGRIPTIITDATPARRRSGGRPTAAGSAERDGRILDAATALFMRDGFAAASIEGIAAAAGVSKRTFYARFPDKQAVFLAVVQRLVATWLVGFDAALERAPTLNEALLAAGRGMLTVALTPQALALHRLVVAEAGRPEIGAALQAGGTRSGIERLCRVLHAHRPDLPPARLAFLAEQFQHLVLAGPQARAIGLGPPMDGDAADAWCRDSVALFLQALG
ncbi:MAG TPA: TetR/AcrR family transcriptional regulator [Acetobacteraceae bacterium]